MTIQDTTISRAPQPFDPVERHSVQERVWEARQVTLRRGTRWVALAVTVLTLASCSSGHGSASNTTSATTTSTSTTTTRTLVVAVDTAATPPGWVPIDYGDAQVSVPSSWTLLVNGCLRPSQGTVFLFGLSVSEKMTCGSGGDFVDLGPGSANAKGAVSVVNGIKVYNSKGEWNVPSLGVELSLTGHLSTRVVATLTHSPRSVALATGSAPPIPASWQRVGFGGMSIAIPGNWTEGRTRSWGGCGLLDLSLTSPPAAVLTTGTSVIRLPCPLVLALPVAPPVDGLVIDPGPYGPLQSESTFGPCLHIDNLTACPTTTDVYGVLVLAVHIPGKSTPVDVEIGLAGNGMVARTILYSMRAG